MTIVIDVLTIKLLESYLYREVLRPGLEKDFNQSGRSCHPEPAALSHVDNVMDGDGTQTALTAADIAQ
jgi:hypothetical protein